MIPWGKCLERNSFWQHPFIKHKKLEHTLYEFEYYTYNKTNGHEEDEIESEIIHLWIWLQKDTNLYSLTNIDNRVISAILSWFSGVVYSVPVVWIDITRKMWLWMQVQLWHSRNILWQTWGWYIHAISRLVVHIIIPYDLWVVILFGKLVKLEKWIVWICHRVGHQITMKRGTEEVWRSLLRYSRFFSFSPSFLEQNREYPWIMFFPQLFYTRSFIILEIRSIACIELNKRWSGIKNVKIFFMTSKLVITLVFGFLSQGDSSMSLLGPFLTPVKWKDWNLPDYPNLIKQPMDMSTIEVYHLLNSKSNETRFIVDDLLVQI